MPQLKVLLGDKVLVTTPIECGQPRNVSFSINMKDLLEERNPREGTYYYYIDRDGIIKNGKYIQYDSEASPHYVIDKENGQDFVNRHFLADKLYVKKNIGGKRRTRRTRKSRKSKKRSTKRRK